MDATIHWKHIQSIDCTDAAPFLIASFDIECDSHHGDFPLAMKNYKKLIAEIVHYWTYKNNKDDIKNLDKADQIDLFKRLIFAGFGYDNIEGISRIYPKKKN